MTSLVDPASGSSTFADSGISVRSPRIVSRINGASVASGFARGWHGDRAGVVEARSVVAMVRAVWGFQSRPAPLLTAPETQHKLELGAVPSYGLTLHHHRFVSRLDDARGYNLCPWAGACTAVCVVENGNGRYDSVQRAWGWRTDLLLHHPDVFGLLWGHELARAVAIVDPAGRSSTFADSGIWCRPNVNSDIPWHLIAPSVVDGTVTGTSVLFYDYSKDPGALLGNGWATRVYRRAASVSERSDWGAVDRCLQSGGSVAVVTDRRRSEPVRQWHDSALVVNADLSDGWMFTGGTIGDLAFKPRDRQTAVVAYRRGFVVGRYR